MNANEYQEAANRTICEQDIVKSKLYFDGVTQLLHASVGISGEAGELSTALEKFLWYRQPLDTTNVVEELGDLMWYIAEACDALDVRLESVMDANIAKLKKRYPEKFDCEKAKEENRDRKSEADEINARIMEQEEQVDDLPNMRCPTKDQNVYLAREYIRRAQLHDKYSRYCKICHIIAVHDASTSCICPDCAAEMRAIPRPQKLGCGCGCIRENTGNKLSKSPKESAKKMTENIIERNHERNQ